MLRIVQRLSLAIGLALACSATGLYAQAPAQQPGGQSGQGQGQMEGQEEDAKGPPQANAQGSESSAKANPKKAKDDQGKKVYRAAIFIKNRAGKKFENKVSVLEDFLSSRLADEHFAVISREDVVNAVSQFAKKGPNQGQKSLKPDDRLDKIASDNTSALRLAQNMNADYLLIGSITAYGVDQRQFSGYGIKYKKNVYNLRLSYKLIDGVLGGTVTGQTVKVSDSERQTENASVDKDMVNNLLDEASKKLVVDLAAKRRKHKIRSTPAGRKWATLRVACKMQDIKVPQVTRDDAGNYVLGPNKYQLNPIDVTVKLDSNAIGTAPGTFKVRPGLHKLRLSRPNFEDWAENINVSIRPNQAIDQEIRVSMTLSDKGRRRFKAMTSFFENLKAKQKLDDAQVKVLEGYAKMLRQSGVRVDMKVDTKEAPTIEHHPDGANIWNLGPAKAPDLMDKKSDDG